MASPSDGEDPLRAQADEHGQTEKPTDSASSTDSGHVMPGWPDSFL